MKDLIPVQFASGRYSHHVTPLRARQMVQSHTAELIGRKKGRQLVRMLEGPDRAASGTRYCHCHEVEDVNPAGVYTLRPILHLPAANFFAVQTSVIR